MMFAASILFQILIVASIIFENQHSGQYVRDNISDNIGD